MTSTDGALTQQVVECGVCRTEEGKPLVLNVVRKAEQKIIIDANENKVIYDNIIAPLCFLCSEQLWRPELKRNL